MECSLEPDGFLQALSLMAAGRGWSRDMVSDNGTIFVGEHDVLRHLADQIEKEKVEPLTSNKGINCFTNRQKGRVHVVWRKQYGGVILYAWFTHRTIIY